MWDTILRSQPGRGTHGCLPSQPLSLTPIEGARQMKTIWNRIHVWLEANAPEGYGHLRPGASVKAIQTAEETMGLKLSDDIKVSYCVHDGQANEPGLIGGE